MSTMEILATGVRAARAAAKKRRTARRARVHTRRLGAFIADNGLAMAGFSCFVAAAAMIAVPLALAVAGVAFFFLDWSGE